MRFVGFDPTDGLASLKTSSEKEFINLSHKRLGNTEQINNKKELLWGLTFPALML